MNKQAYLIMAHNNFYNLEKLIILLDYPEVDIFLHIDAKVKDFHTEYYKKLVKHSNIYIYSKYSANWGGYSLVQCEMFLLKKAMRYGPYMYYHLLSGADLPIKSITEIHNFFCYYNGYEFVQFSDIQLKERHKELTRRVTLYHLIQEYRKRSRFRVIRGALTYLAKALMCIQIIFRVNRFRSLDTEIKYGSQWFSITHKFAVYLLNHKAMIDKHFRWTMCPDEIFIQTVLYNSPFREAVYQYKFQNSENGNMREINWERTNDPAHPYTWRMDDLNLLLSSDMLFARKFDEKVDKGVIDQLYENLRG